MRRLELAGRAFGHLRPDALAFIKNGHAFWRCLCKCGNEIDVSAAHLISGQTRSCGCLRSKRNAAELRDHLIANRTIVGECWIWNGARNRHGEYGIVGYGSLKRGHGTVHRLAAHLWNDVSLSEPLYICHACDVKACFNPAHLYIGTPKQNTADAIARGLRPRTGPLTEHSREAHRRNASRRGRDFAGRFKSAKEAGGVCA